MDRFAGELITTCAEVNLRVRENLRKQRKEIVYHMQGTYKIVTKAFDDARTRWKQSRVIDRFFVQEYRETNVRTELEQVLDV